MRRSASSAPFPRQSPLPSERAEAPTVARGGGALRRVRGGGAVREPASVTGPAGPRGREPKAGRHRVRAQGRVSTHVTDVAHGRGVLRSSGHADPQVLSRELAQGPAKLGSQGSPVPRPRCPECGSRVVDRRAVRVPEKLYCSARCRRRAISARSHARRRAPKDRPTHCAGCGGSIPLRLGPGRPRRFCSERCRRASLAAVAS